MADERNEELQREIEDLKSDIAQLKADLDSMSKSAAGLTREKLMETRMRVRDAIGNIKGQAKEKMNQQYDYLRGQGHEMIDKSREEIMNKPFVSVAAAFAAGAVCSILMRKK